MTSIANRHYGGIREFTPKMIGEIKLRTGEDAEFERWVASVCADDFRYHGGFFSHEIERKVLQIRDARDRKCGNCDRWMKSSCDPEKKRGQFKDCDSWACRDFIFKEAAKEQLNKFESDLNDLHRRIVTMTKNEAAE
jgi:hypothetical protein